MTEPHPGTAFLKKFFAPPNEILLSDIAAGGQSRSLVPWVEPLLGPERRSTVLPCRRGEKVVWYGIPANADEFPVLGEELVAAIGPSYSTMRGQRALLNREDPIEDAVDSFTEGFAWRFHGNNAIQNRQIWEQLELLRGLRGRKPDLSREVPRAPARVLRDLFMALLARNAEGAQSHLEYLEQHNYVTPSNLLFLRVQVAATLCRWTEVLTLAHRHDVLVLRRPVAVTQALLEALYEQHISRFEAATDVDGAIASFKAAVMPRYGQLLRSRAGLRSPPALKMLMLSAVTSSPPDATLRDALLAHPDLTAPDRDFLRLVSSQLAPEPHAASPADSLGAAHIAFQIGDYDSAFAAANAAPPSAARAALLILVAFELLSLDVTAEASAAVAALSDSERAEIFHRRLVADAYARIANPVDVTDSRGTSETVNASAVAQAVAPLPLGWGDWVAWAIAGRSEQQSISVARQGADQWSPVEFFGAPGEVDLMIAALNDNGDAIQLALPHFVRFLERDPEWPRPEQRDLYVTTLLSLTTYTNGSADELDVAVQLASALMSLGLESSLYSDVVDYLRHAMSKSQSVEGIDAGLEILDAMVQSPCPSEDLRRSLVPDVRNLIAKFWRRIDAAQRDLFNILTTDLGLDESALAVIHQGAPGGAASTGDASVLSNLNSRTVAVYTLTERAGQYLKQLLSVHAAQATVNLFHDKVATQPLRQAAKTADVFIMVTGSATHAATGAIQQARDGRLPLLRPSGKGIGSMLRELVAYLEGEQREAA